MYRILLVSTLLVVGACATSNPESNQVESVPVANSSSSEVRTNYSSSSSTPSASVATLESSETVAGNVENIQDVEAPGASEGRASAMQTPSMAESAIVCERVVPTGSILPVRVCRHRSDIERNRTTDQKMIDDIKRSTANGASRL